MENNFTYTEEELKPYSDYTKSICRCCLSTERAMYDIVYFIPYIQELAAVKVSESDGMPPWLCYECCALIQKAVRIKRKLLKSHAMLYEYLTRCAPFPIDAQDPELRKYETPHLYPAVTLLLDNSGKGKTGFHKVLTHEKEISNRRLYDVDINAEDCNSTDAALTEKQEEVKEEAGISDYEDNITLHEYKLNNDRISEDDLNQILKDAEKLHAAVDNAKKKKKKKKEGKKIKKTKKKFKTPVTDHETEKKSSVRKHVELDPTKIKIVLLNPEEQVKQREEESKAGVKFPHQCNLCYKGFNYEVKLQNHMKKHSPSRGPYECKLCSMYLPTPYSYSVHSLIHTQRYECTACGRRMIDRASIVDHYRTQHEGLMTVYTCHLCGKVSNNNKTHRGHMRNHHAGDRPKCDQCGKTFVNKDSLADHLLIHEGVKNYECGTCGKWFRTRTQYKSHQLKHSDLKEYYCVECDARFKTQYSLRQHLQKSLKHRDTQTLKYPCTRCPKRYESEARLRQHAAVQHEGVRAYACPQCAATLATRSSLSKHINAVHVGRYQAPRHVCDTCGKAFRGKSVLINHVRTHTGEKPFECTECGRRFAQRTAMRTHHKLVHLKVRRTAKIKPEVSGESKAGVYPKEEPVAPAPAPLVFESWGRAPPAAPGPAAPSGPAAPAGPAAPCDVYFHVPPAP